MRTFKNPNLQEAMEDSMMEHSVTSIPNSLSGKMMRRRKRPEISTAMVAMADEVVEEEEADLIGGDSTVEDSIVTVEEVEEEEGEVEEEGDLRGALMIEEVEGEEEEDVEEVEVDLVVETIFRTTEISEIKVLIKVKMSIQENSTLPTPACRILTH